MRYLNRDVKEDQIEVWIFHFRVGTRYLLPNLSEMFLLSLTHQEIHLRSIKITADKMCSLCRKKITRIWVRISQILGCRCNCGYNNGFIATAQNPCMNGTNGCYCAALLGNSACEIYTTKLPEEIEWKDENVIIPMML